MGWVEGREVVREGNSEKGGREGREEKSEKGGIEGREGSRQ